MITLNPAAAPAVADPKNPQLPEPKIVPSQELGGRIRWFEQAFEWENVAYVLYPYFWGRRETWLKRFALKNDDPLFLSFLQAGYARVVVPVRIGFERAVQFYLNTGLPWLGGDVPVVGDKSQDPLYLDVAEEIKALTGGGEEGDLDEPVGDPWEYTLPTTVIMLRSDGTLPEWHRMDGQQIMRGQLIAVMQYWLLLKSPSGDTLIGASDRFTLGSWIAFQGTSDSKAMDLRTPGFYKFWGE